LSAQRRWRAARSAARLAARRERVTAVSAGIRSSIGRPARQDLRKGRNSAPIPLLFVPVPASNGGMPRPGPPLPVVNVAEPAARSAPFASKPLAMHDKNIVGSAAWCGKTCHLAGTSVETPRGSENTSVVSQPERGAVHKVLHSRLLLERI
jgi:hypothetical protein